MKIVVIGGTGLIGSKLVERLSQRGNQVVAAAPDTGVDTMTGKGLAEALAGAAVVVDVSNSRSFDEQVATDFFRTSGRNLIAAEVAAGVRHHVALSVVGTERLQDSGYFRAKLAQETLIKSSPIPYTLVHATQFFEFIRAIADFSTEDSVVRLPPVEFQPIAAQDVAEALADVAVGDPANGVIEVAGPETFTLDEGVRIVLQSDNDSRQVVADADARYYGARVSERSLVPGPRPRLGTTRLDWWLTHVARPAKAQAPVPMAARAPA
jgi:uncharacterized protein YbjT (DUF2867 family)